MSISQVKARVLTLSLGAVLVSGAIGMLFLFFQRRDDRRLSSSCANHAIQHKFTLSLYLQRAEHFPSETDTRLALALMTEAGNSPDNWLDSLASACPEAYQRNKSIGYIFVADALPTKTVSEKRALVLFCPAESHQRSQEHCHALLGAGEMECLNSNAQMISLLRQEIARAKEGQIPYSARSLSEMERQLALRERFHDKRDEPE